MRLPPHSTVAHMGRGVTPHCSWHLSIDSFRLKGCTAHTGPHQIILAPCFCSLLCEFQQPQGPLGWLSWALATLMMHLPRQQRDPNAMECIALPATDAEFAEVHYDCTWSQYMSCLPSLEKGWNCSVHLQIVHSALWWTSIPPPKGVHASTA